MCLNFRIPIKRSAEIFFPLWICVSMKRFRNLFSPTRFTQAQSLKRKAPLFLFTSFFFFFKPFIHLCLLYLATFPCIPIFMTQLGVGNTLVIFDYSFTFNEKLPQTGIFSLSLSRTFLLVRSTRFCAFFGTIQRQLVFFWTHLISEPKVIEA